jgi:hypothetical protein
MCAYQQWTCSSLVVDPYDRLVAIVVPLDHHERVLSPDGDALLCVGQRVRRGRSIDRATGWRLSPRASTGPFTGRALLLAASHPLVLLTVVSESAAVRFDVGGDKVWWGGSWCPPHHPSW